MHSMIRSSTFLSSYNCIDYCKEDGQRQILSEAVSGGWTKDFASDFMGMDIPWLANWFDLKISGTQVRNARKD